MKKILSLLTALSFCLISFGQWTNQISGTTENLYAIQFVNSNIGYTVGYNGTILKTIDGGSNWTSLNSNVTILLRSVYFIDNNTYYASGSVYNQTTGLR